MLKNFLVVCRFTSAALKFLEIVWSCFCRYIFLSSVVIYCLWCLRWIASEQITAVSKDHQAEIDVDQEARKWATRIARENRTIHNATKALSLLKEEKNKVRPLCWLVQSIVFEVLISKQSIISIVTKTFKFSAAHGLGLISPKFK